MSVRSELQTQLRADFKTIPALSKVAVLATERELDDIQRPTVLIRQKSVAKAPSAPQGYRQVGILLTVISPLLDLDKAGDQLDALVESLLDYLDTRVMHDDATAVGYNERLAYDIPLTVLASKE